MYTHFPITRQACMLYRSAGNPTWTTSLKSLTSETESIVLLDGTLGKSREILVVHDIGGGNQIIPTSVFIIRIYLRSTIFFLHFEKYKMLKRGLPEDLLYFFF